MRCGVGDSLHGATAWITGGGRGIGRACALRLAARGAAIVVISRTRSELEAVAEDARALGVEARAVVCDVCDPDAVERSLADLGPASILVNSAGTNEPAPFVDITLDSYDRLMDLNMKATFVVTQHFVRRRLRDGGPGAIVNVTSQMGHVGSPNRTVYCASKHAVEGFTKALAVELGPRGIRVNSVAPTFVETEMTKPFLANPEVRSWALGEIALQQFGTVDDVAAAVAFLASPEAQMITGTSLLVDGGWTAH